MHVDKANTTVRHVGLWIATLATVAPLVYAMARSLDAPRPLGTVLLALFIVLTTWIALWFWIATTGFWLAWYRRVHDARRAALSRPEP